MIIQKLIILFVILGCLTLPGIAEIEIMYPQNNTTTDVYYSTTTSLEYSHLENNTIPNAEYTHVIIANKISDTNNLVESPEKLFDNLSGIFYLVVFVFVILLITYTLKKVLL